MSKNYPIIPLVSHIIALLATHMECGTKWSGRKIQARQWQSLYAEKGEKRRDSETKKSPWAGALTVSALSPFPRQSPANWLWILLSNSIQRMRGEARLSGCIRRCWTPTNGTEAPETAKEKALLQKSENSARKTAKKTSFVRKSKKGGGQNEGGTASIQWREAKTFLTVQQHWSCDLNWDIGMHCSSFSFSASLLLSLSLSLSHSRYCFTFAWACSQNKIP